MRDIGVKIIRFVTPNDVKDVVSAINNKCNYEVHMKHGEYEVNAKSIMGVFSLNLSEPIAVLFENIDDYNSVTKVLQKYEDKLAENEWKVNRRTSIRDCCEC